MSTDTEIVDWISHHLSEIHNYEEEVEIWWVDDNDADRETKGENLRDAVRKAMDSCCWLTMIG